MNRRELGVIGERLAKDFLKKKGYRIRETNFRCRQGEIDIVAERKDYLVFVEVRTRTGTSFGSPEESVTYSKREKLVTAALTYISSHRNLPGNWRIDFVAVELDAGGKVSRIELMENVIS